MSMSTMTKRAVAQPGATTAVSTSVRARTTGTTVVAASIMAATIRAAATGTTVERAHRTPPAVFERGSPRGSLSRWALTMPAARPASTPRIAIVGSGFAGIGMAIRLKRMGIASFVIYEAAHDVGGTWRDNV